MDARLGPYRTRRPTGSPMPAAQAADREGWLLLLILAVVGGVPWIGLAVGGRWSPAELGLGTVILAFAAAQALRSWSTARRSDRV